MTANVTEGQRVTVLDPAGRGTIHGRVTLCRPSGCAVDDERGVRYWTTYDRVTPVRRKAVDMPYHHDLFGPLMDIERTFWNYDCEDCIGMKDHGCYCLALGAYLPGGK